MGENWFLLLNVVVCELIANTNIHNVTSLFLVYIVNIDYFMQFVNGFSIKICKIKFT